MRRLQLVIAQDDAQASPVLQRIFVGQDGAGLRPGEVGELDAVKRLALAGFRRWARAGLTGQKLRFDGGKQARCQLSAAASKSPSASHEPSSKNGCAPSSCRRLYR